MTERWHIAVNDNRKYIKNRNVRVFFYLIHATGYIESDSKKEFLKEFLTFYPIIIISMYYLRSIELELDFYLTSSKLFNSYKNIFVFLYISHDK